MIFLHATDHAVTSLAFSPDGAALAAVSAGESVRLWDSATGTVQWEFNNPHGRGFQRVAFLPQSAGLLTCGPGGVWHWDLARRSGLDEPINLDATSDMALTPDGYRVLLTHVGEPESIQCRPWRGEHVSWRRTYTELDPVNLGHPAREFQLAAFSRSGRFAATAGYDSRAYVWDAETGGLVARSDLLPHPATSIAFSMDGRTLAICARRKLSVWWFFNMAELFRSMADQLAFTAVAFNPTGRILAASCDDDTVRFWDTRHWFEVQTFQWEIGGINALTFSPDGLRAACAGNSGKIVIWDVDL